MSLGDWNQVRGCPDWYYGLLIQHPGHIVVFDVQHRKTGQVIEGLRASGYRTTTLARKMGVTDLKGYQHVAQMAIRMLAKSGRGGSKETDADTESSREARFGCDTHAETLLAVEAADGVNLRLESAPRPEPSTSTPDAARTRKTVEGLPPELLRGAEPVTEDEARALLRIVSSGREGESGDHDLVDDLNTAHRVARRLLADAVGQGGL
jgi:hypothetical protein